MNNKEPLIRCLLAVLILFALESSGKKAAAISDFCLHDDRLLILSYAKTKKDSRLRTAGLKKMGALWSYDLAGGGLTLMRRFENKQPEGVALRLDAEKTDAEEGRTVAVVFDGGGETPSRLMEFFSGPYRR